jgi:transcriptional regulator with XRE-family HTH domain
MASTIKTIRLRRGQTLTQVARAIGTDAGNLSRVENGKQNPSPRMAARLAKHFGYEITEIQILYPERFVDSPTHSS